MRQSEVDRLAHEMAYDSAISTVNGMCVHVQIGEKDWCDTKDTCSGCTRFVEQAVEYLELSGILLRHPKRRDLVRWKSRRAH